MILLAFDCSTSGCSAALMAEGRVLARGEAQAGASQSEALMPLLARVMAEGGLAWTSLGLIGVTVGPGSFTGVRIGLSAARGLALALGIEVAGIGTADALAAGVPASEQGERPILVAIDGKRADLFVQAFDARLAPLGPVAAMMPEDAARLLPGPPLLVGDGAARLAALMPGAIPSAAPSRPDPAVLAELAARRFAEGTALAPEPLYLRSADVTLPGVRP